LNEPTEQAVPAPVTGWKREVVLTLDRWIYRLAKRWLALFNVGIGLYVLLPILAPVLIAGSAPQIGRALYTIYRPACHQLPERSLFLFGPQRIYSLEELHAAGLVAEQDGPLERQRFLGAPGIGYKIALCQRDLALYGCMVATGLVFGLVRKRLRPLRLWVFGLMLLPLAVDGGTQLLMLRESNWVLRFVTGLLTGTACVWLLYPHLEEAFDDLRRQANKRVHLEPIPPSVPPV
jgi:uncharacterized membrane protein